VLDEYLYINKPVEETTLLAAIERALKKTRLQFLEIEGDNPLFPA
jgi:FixJ family two-component response regulator